MHGTSLKNILLGFVAGAIATVTTHEIIALILNQAGLFGRVPWPMEANSFSGLPQALNDMFWGGVWGIVFALILGNYPKGSMTIKGALLGIIGPAIIGVFSLVPALTAKFPPFFGGDLNMIWPVLVILAGFGASTAWLYGFFTSGCRLP